MAEVISWLCVTRTHAHAHTHTHTHTHTQTRTHMLLNTQKIYTLQVSFSKRAMSCGTLSRKITYKDKASYASSLPCTRRDQSEIQPIDYLFMKFFVSGPPRCRLATSCIWKILQPQPRWWWGSHGRWQVQCNMQHVAKRIWHICNTLNIMYYAALHCTATLRVAHAHAQLWAQDASPSVELMLACWLQICQPFFYEQKVQTYWSD